MFSKDVFVSLTRLFPKRVQRTWVCPSSSALSHKTFPLVCFFITIKYATHIKLHKANLMLHSNCTALLVAPLQSAQSLPNSFSGKSTTMQFLRLAGVLGDSIADCSCRQDTIIIYSSGTKPKTKIIVQIVLLFTIPTTTVSTYVPKISVILSVKYGNIYIVYAWPNLRTCFCRMIKIINLNTPAYSIESMTSIQKLTLLVFFIS